MLFVMQLQNHQLKVSVLNRVLSKIIDIVIIVAMAAILPYPLGPLLGFLYSLFADGLNYGPFKGQSIGKRLLGLRVRSRIRNQPANFKESALRNAPVGVATFFAIIPVWGWVILALIGIPLMLMEIYLMLSVDTGHRLGDVMGDTEVIELKSQ
jgi:uncharacterized RDD family membrane protein YckC